MIKALITGSFDPLTSGHLNIVQRAAKLCDELVIGIIHNPAKIPLFSIEEKKEMVACCVADIPNVEVDSFTGLLADYVNKNKFNIVFRGLCATSDFEYEIQMAQMNARIFDEGIETVFLMTDPKYSFISSSMIKEVFLLGGDVTGLVPQQVLDFMKKKKRDEMKI